MFFISFDTGSGTYGDVYKVLKFSLIFKSVSPLLTIIMLCVIQAKRLANNEWAAIKVIKLEPGISQ